MPELIGSVSTARIIDNYRSITSLGLPVHSDTRAPKHPMQVTDTVRISQEARERLELLNQVKRDEVIRQQHLRREQDEAIKRNLELLELGADASKEAIRSAYYHLMRNYHPDRYSHLPPEFRELAESKAKQIIEAYDNLTK
jgi:DnaJ-domain-containing protein 1